MDIKRQIERNIIKAKTKNAMIAFVNECIEPIKNKAVTNRVIPKIEMRGDTWHEWARDFEIDGFKGRFQLSLQKEDRYTYKETYLRCYCNLSDGEREYITVQIDGRGETWADILQDINNHEVKKLPTEQEIADYLQRCEEFKKLCKQFEDSREYSVFYDDYCTDRISSVRFWN